MKKKIEDSQSHTCIDNKHINSYLYYLTNNDSSYYIYCGKSGAATFSMIRMIADYYTLEAFKTPLEVAQYRQMREVIPLLIEHLQLNLLLADQELETQAQTVKEIEQLEQLTNQTKQQVRKDEVVPDVEVFETESNKCMEAIDKALGKSESEVRQMIRRGEVPVNIWSAVWSRYSETQKKVLRLQQEKTDMNEELIKVNEQIAQIQQRKMDLEQRLRDVQQTLRDTIISPQVLDAVETLARAEHNEQKQLKSQLKAEKENTVLSIEDIGYFLNVAGLSGNTREVISLAEQDNATEMILDDIYLYVCATEIESRLEVQFVIDMVRHDQYPPYDKHRNECPVCRNSVAELLTEYQISFKESEVAKISSSGLMYLEHASIAQLLVTNTMMERLQSMKAIKQMRQNHINFIAE